MPLVDNHLSVPGHEYRGDILAKFAGSFDPGLHRPFYDQHDQACVLANTGQWTVEKGERVPIRRKQRIRDLLDRGFQLPPVANATSLRKEDWIHLDQAVVRARRQRLQAWSDLASRNPFGGFNAYNKMTLEYEAMSDPGEAVVDMDGLAAGRTDSPLFKLRSLPLPITHSDFWFSDRRLAISRNSDTPLDTVMAEAASRRVAETIEQTTIGTVTGLTYGTQSTGITAHDGNSTVYGYTNYTHRVTKTDLTTPTGTNPEAVMTDVLEMVETMQSNGYFGPYVLYHSTGYSRYLSDDYFRTGSTSAVRSLRMRLMEIEGIQDIRRLDYLTSGYQLVMVQMDPEVCQAVIGMDFTTVQWESEGGSRKNFKVMAILVPLLRVPYNGTSGILHGTTS